MNYYDNLLKVCYALMAWAISSAHDEQVDRVLSEHMSSVSGDLPSLAEFVKLADIDEYVDLERVGQDLKTAIETKYRRDTTIRAVQMDQFNSFQRWFRVRSEPAFKTIEKLAKTQAERWVQTLFSKEIQSQTPQLEALRAIVRKTAGHDSPAYKDEEEAKSVKEKYPEVYKEFLRLRREFNQTWKDALASFVIKSGNKTILMQDAEKFFKDNDLKTNLPSGFTGRIDAAGQFYSEEGKLLNGVPSAVIFPEVRMNPDRNPNSPWVFQAVRSNGVADGGYFYEVEFIRSQRTKKFEKVGVLLEIVDEVRPRWISMINSYKEDDPKAGAAVIIELLYAFSARIGSVGNEAGGKPTFGISTILNKQLFDKESKMVFRYLGKDGVKTIHNLIPDSPVNKKIIAILRKLKEDKDPKDYVFTYLAPNGVKKRITGMIVNNLFKSLTGHSDITVHKLRTYHGTKLAKELIDAELEKGISFSSTKEALAWLKSIAEQVGKKLNHVRRSTEGEAVVTGSTALSAYIDPALQASVFQKWNLAYPRYLDKLLNG